MYPSLSTLITIHLSLPPALPPHPSIHHPSIATLLFSTLLHPSPMHPSIHTPGHPPIHPHTHTASILPNPSSQFIPPNSFPPTHTRRPSPGHRQRRRSTPTAADAEGADHYRTQQQQGGGGAAARSRACGSSLTRASPGSGRCRTLAGAVFRLIIFDEHQTDLLRLRL